MIGFAGYGMSGSGWVWVLIFAAVLIIPFWKILPRHGIQSWFSVLAVIPIGAVILLWIVAFKDDLDKKTDGA